MSSKYHSVIGIDLGTTYSAVSAFNKHSKTAEIIKNHVEWDSETTPSVISLDPLMRKVIVGFSAKRQIENPNIRPEDTIIEIKREMGAFFKDEGHLEKFNAKSAGKRIHDPVEVFFAGRWNRPQEISAFILMKMKEIAEKEIGEEIRDAVVTVPTYFTEPQRKATEEAALLAGMYPRQIIPAPTAAAICYGLDRMESEKKNYLIYDLGGGTCDVTVFGVEGNNIDVEATSGDPRLGGVDFDDRLTQWVVKQIQEKKPGYTVDAASLARIKAGAEKAKITLSIYKETTLDLLFLQIPELPFISITRDIFENVIKDLLEHSLNIVDEAMNISTNDRGVSRDMIDAIILVGGSGKIPKVRSMLINYFDKDESFIKEANPATVVARGAAILAYKFKPSPPPFNIKQRSQEGLTNPDADDVVGVQGLITEHSLGVGLADNTVVNIINRGQSIPTIKKIGTICNAAPTERILVHVYQGEGKYTFDNELIGTLQIINLDPTKGPGQYKFEITFQLDVNGLLTMTVLNLNENRTYEGTFEQRTGAGGDDQLIIMREKLLELYAGSAV